MAARTDGTARAFWRFLELVLDAYAVSCDIDADLATFAMVAAFAVAQRLALSEQAIGMMRDSAVAEIRQRRRGGRPS